MRIIFSRKGHPSDKWRHQWTDFIQGQWQRRMNSVRCETPGWTGSAEQFDSHWSQQAYVTVHAHWPWTCIEKWHWKNTYYTVRYTYSCNRSRKFTWGQHKIWALCNREASKHRCQQIQKVASRFASETNSTQYLRELFNKSNQTGKSSTSLPL